MAKKEKEKDEETIYDEKGREDLIGDDELSPEEEAFMRGYDEADEEGQDTKDMKESSDEEDTEE